MSSVGRTTRPESLQRIKAKQATKQQKPESAGVENCSPYNVNDSALCQQEHDFNRRCSLAEPQRSSYGHCPKKTQAPYPPVTQTNGKTRRSGPTSCASHTARIINETEQSAVVTTRIPRAWNKLGLAAESKLVTGTPTASHRVSKSSDVTVDINSRFAAPLGQFPVMSNCTSGAQRSRNNLSVLKWSQREGYALRQPTLPTGSASHKKSPVVYPRWTGPCIKEAYGLQKFPVSMRQGRLKSALESCVEGESDSQQQPHSGNGEAVTARRNLRDIISRVPCGSRMASRSGFRSPQVLDKMRPPVTHPASWSSSANESVFDTPASQYSKAGEETFLEFYGEDLSFIKKEHVPNVANVCCGRSMDLGQTCLSVEHRAIDVDYCKSHCGRQEKQADSVSSRFSNVSSRNTSASKQLSVSEFLEGSYSDSGQDTSDTENAITCSDSVKTTSTGQPSILTRPLFLSISTPTPRMDYRRCLSKHNSGTTNISTEIFAPSATVQTNTTEKSLLNTFCRSPILATQESLSPTAPLVESVEDPRLLGIVKFSPLLGAKSLTPCPFSAPLQPQHVLPGIESYQQYISDPTGKGIPGSDKGLELAMDCDKIETTQTQSATTFRLTREVAKARIPNRSGDPLRTKNSVSLPAPEQSTGSCPLGNGRSEAMHISETHVVLMQPRVRVERCGALLTVTRIPNPSIIDVQNIVLMVQNAHNSSLCVGRTNRLGFRTLPVGVAACLLCVCFSVLWALQKLHTVDVLYDQYIA